MALHNGAQYPALGARWINNKIEPIAIGVAAGPGFVADGSSGQRSLRMPTGRFHHKPSSHPTFVVGCQRIVAFNVGRLMAGKVWIRDVFRTSSDGSAR